MNQPETPKKRISSGLSGDTLVEVMGLPDRDQRFLAGVVDLAKREVRLLRGNLNWLTAPFDFFVPSGDGIKPDFEQFAIIDYGHTVAFGPYEAASDVIIDTYGLTP